MKIKSLKSTNKLVRGAVYEALALYNNNSKKLNHFSPYVIININGYPYRTSTSNIKNEDGSDLPEINWECEVYKDMKANSGQYLNTDDVKIGDYVTPRNNTLKSLIIGRKYKVTNVQKIKHESISKYSKEWVETKISIEGSNRLYSAFTFKKCSVSESRNINLNEVLGQPTDLEKANTTVRKIETFSDTDRDRILISVLMTAVLDRSRNNMSIMQWAVKKIGSRYSVIESDFDNLLDNTIKSIVERFD